MSHLTADAVFSAHARLPEPAAILARLRRTRRTPSTASRTRAGPAAKSRRGLFESSPQPQDDEVVAVAEPPFWEGDGGDFQKLGCLHPFFHLNH